MFAREAYSIDVLEAGVSWAGALNVDDAPTLPGSYL
jgi:hypothetical protein